MAFAQRDEAHGSDDTKEVIREQKRTSDAGKETCLDEIEQSNAGNPGYRRDDDDDCYMARTPSTPPRVPWSGGSGIVVDTGRSFRDDGPW